jgi:hypothetical protein
MAGTTTRGRKPARGGKGRKTRKENGKNGKGRGASGDNGSSRPPPVATGSRSRAERALADARTREIDDVCAAWAAIVAERMAADQTFAELFEQYAHRPADLRGLFVWDALLAAESHVALINSVIARHLDAERRADPLELLADLRGEQQKIATAYAVNAFSAVLNQMLDTKAKWLPMEDFDPRIAVLALAHQNLGYALQVARVPAPVDLTDHILRASQDEAVWARRRGRGALGLTEAACEAAAAFFRGLGSEVLTSGEEIAALYSARASERPPPGAQPTTI